MQHHSSIGALDRHFVPGVAKKNGKSSVIREQKPGVVHLILEPFISAAQNQTHIKVSHAN
jgi:hypothetical protein